MFESAAAQLFTQGVLGIVAVVEAYVIYTLWTENNSLKDELVSYIKEQKAGTELAVASMNETVKKILDLVINLGQK